MSIKISQLPWQVVTLKSRDGDGAIESEFVQVIDAEGFAISQSINGNDIDQSEHNFDFIINACNSHDQLVDALTMIRDADNDCLKDGLPRIPRAARAKIDAALAAAK